MSIIFYKCNNTLFSSHKLVFTDDIIALHKAQHLKYAYLSLKYQCKIIRSGRGRIC